MSMANIAALSVRIQKRRSFRLALWTAIAGLGLLRLRGALSDSTLNRFARFVARHGMRFEVER